MATTGFERGTDGPRVLLVGVDGSPTSMRAGAYALGLARRQHSRLVVVHVASSPVLAQLSPGTSWPMEQTLADIAADLRRESEEGAASFGHEIEWVARRGDPYTELTLAAREVMADAVIVGASTHAGHRLIGSIAVRLVRNGRWPVTVVP